MCEADNMSFVGYLVLSAHTLTAFSQTKMTMRSTDGRRLSVWVKANPSLIQMILEHVSSNLSLWYENHKTIVRSLISL